jgi:serine protease AprX
VKIRSAFPILSVLLATIFSATSSAQSRYWIFFKDKPNAEIFPSFSKDLSGQEATASSGQQIKSVENYLVENGVLTQRAIDRRLKVLPPSSVVSVSDFPVYPPYLDSLQSISLTVTGTSRWFNAAVVNADSTRLVQAEKFPFVLAIKKVAVYVNPIKPIYSTEPERGRLSKLSDQIQPGDSSFYGPSYAQYELSGIPQVHSLGIDGAGVLIGMLDAGFRYQTHDALKNIRIVGEHDFIQNDSITANQPGDSQDQDNHGTMTLSLLGAYAPGNLVGVDYGADFILAKTEYVPVSDYKWEEDNWVEGLEWMEARGVDVVSSSLGYNIFVDSSGNVDSSASYFWSRGDFNGKKAMASRAAARAANLGVVVVDAMGNEGNGDGTDGTLDVPADADSIISAGAVGTDSLLAAFSSTGPTNDGRIKPDLVADGVYDYVAEVPGPDTYTTIYSGTSFATPITAGVAGLVLSVRPDLTPMQVINLLKSTAVRVNDPQNPMWTSRYPNNFYGWGIVNAWNAIKTLADQFSFWHEDTATYFGIRAFSTPGVDVGLSAAYYSIDGASFNKVAIFPTDTIGQYAFKIPSPISLKSSLSFYFDIVDSSLRHLTWLYHNAKLPITVSGVALNPGAISDNFILYNNYPNPFNSQTQIGILLKNDSHVRIDVFDVIGRKIKTLFNGNASQGFHELTWNGRSDKSQEVGSGVYLVRVDVNGSVRTLKVLFLK